jgi:Dolichyl-phosphate-mannose-protein mannosyltransferase
LDRYIEAALDGTSAHTLRSPFQDPSTAAGDATGDSVGTIPHPARYVPAPGRPVAEATPGWQPSRRPGPRVSHRSPRSRTGLRNLPWPLLAVLIVQAALSLRLVRANTAFEDEALYLWAGHLEWSHWLHGTVIPEFPTYFSGAPVVYPVLGAVADSIGGLTGARLLSLLFMLGATSLLWSVTARLFGRRAAFFAAASWAVLAPTARLGAFATYDAMALFLITLAVWFATGSIGRRDTTKWMVAAAATLTLANATKYASTLFDPVVVGMAILSGYPRPGGKGALRRGALLTAIVVELIILLLQIGRGWYLSGIDQTTLTRHSGGTPVTTVLLSSWDWVGVIIIAAAISVIVCLASTRELHTRLLVIILAATSVLVPAQQARIHTFTSLSKHVDFGAWFAAIAVGYGVDRLLALVQNRRARCSLVAVTIIGVSAVGYAGIAQANTFFAWPGAANLVPVLTKLVRPGDRVLADNTPTLEYYMPQIQWQQWSSVYGITLPSGRRVAEESDALAPYKSALDAHYFKFVVLAFTDKPQLDLAIASYLHTDHDYRFVRAIPFSNSGSHGSYLLWEYQPRARHVT